MGYATSDGKPIELKTLVARTFKLVIPLEDVRATPYYEDMADLAEIFQHEIIEDEHGTWRWRENGLISLLHEHAPVYTPSGAECNAKGIMPYTRQYTKEFRASLDLNGLAMDFHAGLYSMEERMKFYMQIGYSLSGYAEVFGQHEASEFNLPGAKTREEDDDEDSYGETVIDYMRRVHEGKTLKL